MFEIWNHLAVLERNCHNKVSSDNSVILVYLCSPNTFFASILKNVGCVTVVSEFFFVRFVVGYTEMLSDRRPLSAAKKDSRRFLMRSTFVFKWVLQLEIYKAGIRQLVNLASEHKSCMQRNRRVSATVWKTNEIFHNIKSIKINCLIHVTNAKVLMFRCLLVNHQNANCLLLERATF
jgi:hypothetical protein